MTSTGRARLCAAALFCCSACRGEPPSLQPPAAELERLLPAREAVPALAGVTLAGLSPATLLLGSPGPRPPRERKPPKAKLLGVLNVNKASEAELRMLPGIGKTRARAILARRALRPFRSIDEIARLPRMRSIVQKLRPHLAVEGDTSLRPAVPDG
jgi:competence protein ComEA